MSLQLTSANADALREQLMAPDPMQRTMGLYRLEREAEHRKTARLAGQVEAFAARGIPYYAPQEPHYQAWVSRALEYWQRLHLTTD